MRFGRITPALGDILSFDGFEYRPVSVIAASAFAGTVIPVITGGTGTAGRLPKFDGTGGILDSQVAVSITGGVATFTATLTGNHSYTLSDADQILAGSTAALTSGRVPYVTTGGLLIDDANLLYAGANLTLGAGSLVLSGSGFAVTTALTTALTRTGHTTASNRIRLSNSSGSDNGTFGQAGSATDASILWATANTTYIYAPTQFRVSTGTAATDYFQVAAAGVAQVGTGTFSTGTGANSLNGPVTCASTAYITTRAAIGASALAAAYTLRLSTPSDLAGTTQVAIGVDTFTATVGATTSVEGQRFNITMADSGQTIATVYGSRVNSIVKPATVTWTRVYGYAVGAISGIAGTGSAGYAYGATAPTGDWSFFNGSAVNAYLGTGATLINTTTDDAIHKLQVAGRVRHVGRSPGVTSVVTAAGTTTLTIASNEVQTFTGSTTQIVQFPLANVAGTGFAVMFCINNQSSGTVTPTRAGSDTFQGGGTTDPVLAGATQWYASNSASVWLKV